jgi:NADP-dependent 3-hydroxy acid dehydrogenase YdfG
MDKPLADAVALVTGGSKGIGFAVARALGLGGARVMITGRQQADLDAAVRALALEGIAATAVAGDVGREADARKAVEETVRLHGGVTILVNNAGIGTFKRVEEMTVEEFDAMWSTNVRGVFLMTRAVLPHMGKAHRGEIVNIASLAGKNTMAGGAGYCATKWALRGFAGSLMLEVREKNIRVVTVFPGSVDTGFSGSTKKRESITQPGDVASAVLFAVTAPGRAMFSEIDVRPTIPR